VTDLLERPARSRKLTRSIRSVRPTRRATPELPAAPTRAAAPPPPTQGEQALSVASTAAVMCCLVAGWMLAQMLLLGGLAQARTQAGLYDEFRAQVASATAPLGPVVPVGEPVALMSVPRLGMEQVVVEGTASGDLLAGPGHLRSTVLPGQLGTSAVFARGTTYGAPFAGIGELRRGDRITVVTAQGEKAFAVIGVRRAGDPLPQPRPAEAARLVLVSSEGNGGRLPSLTADEVVYVDAEAEEGFPLPPGAPGAVPDSEQAMGTEPGAMPLLALCLGLLLAMAFAVAAARQRFHAAVVWIVTAPVVIALAWVTTDVVMRLLPNLM